MTKLSRNMRMIYREIPETSRCKAKCMDCCGPVPWSDEEFSRVQAEVPVTAIWNEIMGVRGLLNPLTGLCPFASPEGCKVYDRRPFMCRLFATSIEDTRLRCPHGVKPPAPLSAVKAGNLTQKYIEASR